MNTTNLNIEELNKALDNIDDIDEALLHKEAISHRVSEARKGYRHSDETKAKMSQTAKGVAKSAAVRAKLSASLKGKLKGREKSEETKAKMKAAWEFRAPRQTYACNRCGVMVTKSNLNRWHNDNCRMKAS